MKVLKISRIFLFFSFIAMFSSCSKHTIKGGMICSNGIDEITFISDSCYIQKEYRYNRYTKKYYYFISVGHYFIERNNVLKLKGDYLCKYLPMFFMEESYRKENDSLKIITFDFTNLQGEKTDLELNRHWVYINDDTINEYLINKKGWLWLLSADTSVDSSYQYIRKMDMKIKKITFNAFSPTVEYYCKTENANHFSITAPDINFNPIRFVGYVYDDPRSAYKFKRGHVYHYGKFDKSWNLLKLIKNWRYYRMGIRKYEWIDSSKISLEEMGAKELIRRWDMKLLEPNSHK